MPKTLARVRLAWVVRRRRAELYGLAMKLCRNEDDAEDLFQEAAQEILQALDRLRASDDTTLVAYMKMIIVNTYRSTHRSRTRHATVGTPQLVEAVQAPAELDLEPWRLIDDDLLEEATEVLSEPERQVWDLRREGLSYQQIALKLDSKAGTVGKALFNARSKVRHRYRALLAAKLKKEKS